MTLTWQQLDASHDIARAWRDVTAACEHATLFHTTRWADAFCRSLPEWRPDPVVLEFGDGNLGVLPLLCRTDSEHRQSMAPYVYGGPLFLKAPGDEHLDEIGKVARWYEDIVLYDNPFSPYPWHQEGLIRWRIHTHVLDLEPGFDRVFSGCRRMIRQHCRAAEATGMSVSVAASMAEVDGYYDAYLDSLSRWGDEAVSCYPRALFHELFRLQQEERSARLWVASLEGQVISGVVVLYHGAHSVAWHSSTHSEYLRLNASPLVHMTAIRASCDEGLRWYDFNPSGHLRGVEFFKESFRTERRRFDMYHSPGFTPPPEWSMSEEPAADGPLQAAAQP